MSRLVFFAIQSGQSVGEIQADCSRSWAINEGGESQVALPVPVPGWLGPGMMAMIEHPTGLPAWAGMVDTDWQAAPSPGIKLYNAEYLLNLRHPDEPLKLKGSTEAKVAKIIAAANEQQELFLTVGDVEGGLETTEEWDQRSWWAQLVNFAQARALELACRPERVNGRLLIRVDLVSRMGVDTNVLLHDSQRGGSKANIEVTSAMLTGEIWNRVIGVGTGSGAKSRLQTAAFVDDASAGLYRMRSHVAQFQDAGDLSQLEALAKADLERTSAPVFALEANVLDVGGIYYSMGLGNGVLAHVANCYLPYGRQGWSGWGRLQKMVIDETSNKLAIRLEARYE